ncbi:hypothetical protein CRG98_018795 [Punica granatum]|uniref:Uncharacterized protein n=1 Tax=Punica granatum TaxID=22663 RepID=A0A2I0JZC4_PUNGR|nr:hypothetical protein CRG98_018795 [Punica granatum]
MAEDRWDPFFGRKRDGAGPKPDAGPKPESSKYGAKTPKQLRLGRGPKIAGGLPAMVGTTRLSCGVGHGTSRHEE